MITGPLGSDDSTRILLGRMVRAARNRDGMTSIELSLRLGISAGGLSAIETGRNGPGLSILIALCRELKLSADVLLGLKEA